VGSQSHGLKPDQRFTKYQWIEVDTTRPRGDARPESNTLRIDSIRRREYIGTADHWRARKDIVFPLRRNSLCEIANDRKKGGATLGIFRPDRITRLAISAAKPPHWTPHEENLLRQQLLGFETAPRTPFEKIPVEFRYQFRCAEATCRGHRIMCTDWEMGQSYRNWHQRYGEGWEAKFRQRYEREMIEKNDTHFFVGNIHQHPDNWLIVGLFYPLKQAIGDLFEP
jgi:hypothetical protein